MNAAEAAVATSLAWGTDTWGGPAQLARKVRFEIAHQAQVFRVGGLWRAWFPYMSGGVCLSAGTLEAVLDEADTFFEDDG